MTKQLVKPCEFVGGACINCAATEQSDCEGWVCSPKRQWVGLTGLEQKAIMAMNSRNAVFETEAKLKEKNHG